MMLKLLLLLRLLHWVKGEKRKPQPKLNIPFDHAPYQVEGNPTERCDPEEIEVRVSQLDKESVQEGVQWVAICISPHHEQQTFRILV